MSMISILTLLCIITGILVFIQYKETKGDIISAVFFSLCTFFTVFLVISAVFFGFDRFSFIPVLSLCAVTTLAALIVCLAKKHQANITSPAKDHPANLREIFQLYIRKSFIKWRVPVVIILLSLPFIHKTHDLYSMGQDQGTYQIKALSLMNDHRENYLEMEEYLVLEDPADRQAYLDFIYAQNNLYLPKYEWETDHDATHFDHITGTIHGLPTYSALMALWGLIFGQRYMMGIQPLLYICFIFIIYITSKCYLQNEKSCIFATLLSAFSPINIWLAKSSLTETILSLYIALFLYLLVKRPRLSFIPILAFGVVHISLFAFMPVIALVYIILYFARNERGHLISMALSAVFFYATAVWALTIAPYYTYGNYQVLDSIINGLFNENNLVYMLAAASFAMAAIAVVLYMMDPAAGLKGKNIIIPKKPLALFIRLLLLASIIYFIKIGVLEAGYIRYVQYLQISGYIYLTGILPIPIIYIVSFIKPELILNKRIELRVVFLLFLYCIILYSMFMKPEIMFYYYFARYCSMFLILAFIMMLSYLEELPSGYIQRAISCICCVCLLTFIPYDAGLIYQKDHSRLGWDLLYEVCDVIGPRDAFIVGPDEQQILWIYPVRFLTGCGVFHAGEDLKKEGDYLKSKGYENVYYMDYAGALENVGSMDYSGATDDTGNTDSANTIDNVEITNNAGFESVWKGTNHLSHLDYMNITMPLTPIPLNYVEYTLDMEIWKL